jgi:hypothetical protein
MPHHLELVMGAVTVYLRGVQADILAQAQRGQALIQTEIQGLAEVAEAAQERIVLVLVCILAAAAAA